MTDTQTDGRTLAARYLKGLNDHDPDAADGYTAVVAWPGHLAATVAGAIAVVA